MRRPSLPRLARPRLPRGRRLVLALAGMLVVGLLGVALVFLAPRLLSRFRPSAPVAATAEPTAEATEHAAAEATGEPGDAPAAVIVSAPRSVQAGVAWSVDIEVAGGAAGENVELLLFNGLTTLRQSVVTGTGGVARWNLAPDAVTQAGESILIARYKGQETRQIVTVRPGPAVQADVLTTANGMRAYGDGRAMLIGLLRDALGNPPRAATRAHLHVRYPDGVETNTPLDLTAGLGWTWVESQGEPGRMRVDITGDRTAAASIELQQLPGETEAVELTITPTCVSAGGRDVIRLVAGARDPDGFMVVDGTLITFTYRSGAGRAQTANGLAALNLPAPAEPGRYRYWARVGEARSATAWLRVTEGLCR